MSLKEQINNALDRIYEKNKQLNFDSFSARKNIAEAIARDLEEATLDESSEAQRRQSDAGSLIF